MSELTVASRMRDALAQAADQLIDIGIGLLSIVLVILLARLLIHFLRRFFWRQSGLKQLEPDAMTLIDNGISFLVYFAAVTVLLALWGASWSTLLTLQSVSARWRLYSDYRIF